MSAVLWRVLMRTRSFVVSVALASVVAAVGLCQDGNGVGQAYIVPTQAIIGQPLTISLGAVNVPYGAAAISGALSYGPTVIPGWGTFWLDFTSPSLFHIPFSLDSNGAATAVAFVPNDPALIFTPPIYVYAAVLDPSLPFPSISVSKTVRIQFDKERRFTPTTNALATARGFHTANSLQRYVGDNRTNVVVAGGGGGTLLAPTAGNSTEIFSPMTRSFTPGPSMAQSRMLHRSVRLQDGRVLYAGGIQTGGNVTASCEIYDPVTNTFALTGAMLSPRAGHGLTLLNDGRVLATGGIPSYAAAQAEFVARMNGILLSAEIYNPVTGTWNSTAGNMVLRRVGHAQMQLPDGSVFISGGIFGSVTPSIFGGPSFPQFTSLCERFDPVTGLFSTMPAMATARAFHGMSWIGTGFSILVSGGLGLGTVGSTTATVAIDSCELINGTAWTNVGALAQPVAFHTQERAADGSVIIAGGLTGDMTAPTASSVVQRHSGTSIWQTYWIGLHPELGNMVDRPRGAHTFTRLYDGSFLFAGGWSANNTPQAETWVTYDF